MTAEELGERLLGEVESERLDKVGDDSLDSRQRDSHAHTTSQFLQTLRHREDPQPSSQLGIPALDKLVKIFQYPRQHETAGHQQPWPSPQHGTPAATAPKLAARPPVIELTSTSPCSGATQFLHYITAVAVLPATFNDIALQGKGGAVVLLDNPGNFDVLRLQQIMRHYIQQHIRPTTPEGAVPIDPTLEADIDALIRSSLQHVHVFRPQCTSSLLATIQSLPSYLVSPTADFSGPRTLQTLLIDDIGAFIWQDRAEDAAQSVLSNPSANPNDSTNNTPRKDPTLLTHRYQTLTSSLRALQSLFTCPIIATNRALLSPSPSSSRSQIRPHLPFPWTSFATLRLIVDRVPVPKFRESLSVQGAWREAEARREVVERGERVVRVDWWGWEAWRAGVGEGLEREGEAVRVWVTGQGVVVSEGLVRWRGG